MTESLQQLERPPMGMAADRNPITLPQGFGVQDQAEFVTSETGQEVVTPHQPLQHFGHVTERAVTGAVAVGLVDLLELVDIDEQQGQRLAPASTALTVPVEPLEEIIAVRQARDCIKKSQGACRLQHQFKAARQPLETLIFCRRSGGVGVVPFQQTGEGHGFGPITAELHLIQQPGEFTLRLAEALVHQAFTANLLQPQPSLLEHPAHALPQDQEQPANHQAAQGQPLLSQGLVEARFTHLQRPAGARPQRRLNRTQLALPG